jgi:hypothetical protein
MAVDHSLKKEQFLENLNENKLLLFRYYKPDL